MQRLRLNPHSFALVIECVPVDNSSTRLPPVTGFPPSSTPRALLSARSASSLFLATFNASSSSSVNGVFVSASGI